MGIPVGATKIVLSGILPGGEIWQTGFWIVGPTLDSSAAASAANALYTIFNQSTGTHLIPALKANWWNGGTQWTTVTVYNYQDTSGIATVTGQKIGSVVSGSSPRNTMDQCALVVTLRTALSGSRHRGRMYFPATGANIDGGSLFQSVDVQAVLDGLKADFAAVEAESHFTGFNVGVLSKELGTATPVTTLTADLRPDIQRRRANRQNRGSMLSVTGL